MTDNKTINPVYRATILRLMWLLVAYCALALTYNPTSHASVFEDSTAHVVFPPLTVSGFIDTYYTFTFAKPPDNIRRYTTQPLYHNEFSINFALLSALYATDRIRGRLSVQTGSFAESNYAAEPPFWRNIFEASLGYRITDNIWVDAGIFPSHIGFESAVSKDSWNYSRSLVADFSPYYETGAKLTWTPDEQWFVSLLVLNGWQNIRETNSGKSFGTQIQWKPSSNLLFNWSTYLGNDQPDSVAQQLRLFQNFYAQLGVNEAFYLALLFDFGMQENPLNNNTNHWWGSALLARYILNKRIAIAARAEYYRDPQGIIAPTGTPHNFQTMSVSANIDVFLAPNLLWRIETRLFQSRDAIYPVEKAPHRSSDGFIVTSLSLSF